MLYKAWIQFILKIVFLLQLYKTAKKLYSILSFYIILYIIICFDIPHFQLLLLCTVISFRENQKNSPQKWTWLNGCVLQVSISKSHVNLLTNNMGLSKGNEHKM